MWRSDGVVDDIIKKFQNNPIELKIGMEYKFDMDNGGGWTNVWRHRKF